MKSTINYLLLVLTFIGVSLPVQSSQTEMICNSLGGQVGDSFYASQYCDYLTEIPVTPMFVSTEAMGKGVSGYKTSEGHWQTFKLMFYKNKVVLNKGFSNRLYGQPLIIDVKGSIDGLKPINFSSINYGYGGQHGSTGNIVREAVIKENEYRVLKQIFKKGGIFKVRWVERDIVSDVNSTYTVEFPLDGLGVYLKHLNKDKFTKLIP